MLAVATQEEQALALAKIQQRIEDAREDLATFISVCGRNEDGGQLELHDMHAAWIWHLNYCWSHGKRAGILAPFGSGKSSGFAVPLVTWMLGNNPQLRVKFVSNVDDAAKARTKSAKQIIESEFYRAVFPEIRRGDPWTDSKLTLNRRGSALDPSIHARGVFTTGVGQRSDLMIFDDVCDQKNTDDPDQRRRVKQLVRQTWLSRLDSSSARHMALWIATPWHVDDATHDLMHDPLWCFLVQRISADFEHLDQEVFNAGPDYFPGGA